MLKTALGRPYDFRRATLLKKSFWHRCFPKNTFSYRTPPVKLNSSLSVWYCHHYNRNLKVMPNPGSLVESCTWFPGLTLLTLSCRRSLSYKNQSIDLHSSKSMDWFLNDRDVWHERVSSIKEKKLNIVAKGSILDACRSFGYRWILK